MFRSRAFTLIELLIVVAIIAILAAIAVPNFLEAQTRSKVARVKSDMRTLATAIEAYTTDYNNAPTQNGSTNVSDFLLRRQATGIWGGAGMGLTTPVSYITSIPGDPFNTVSVRANQFPHLSPYSNLVWASAFYRRIPTPGIAGQGFPTIEKLFNVPSYTWSVQSAGPDTIPYPENHTESPLLWCPIYDPTNGTVSRGDVWYFGGSGIRGGGGR